MSFQKSLKNSCEARNICELFQRAQKIYEASEFILVSFQRELQNAKILYSVFTENLNNLSDLGIFLFIELLVEIFLKL